MAEPTRAERVAEIVIDLEAFFAEPPEVQQDVILHLKHNKPAVYQRLQEFLRGPDAHR